MYEQEKVHELSFSHPESEFIPSMCRLYRLLACGEAFDCVWLYPLDRRQGHVPKSESPVGSAVATKSSTSPYRSTACTGQDVVGMNWRSVVKTCHLVEFVSNVLLKSQVLAVVSNAMMFLPGPRRRHYMPHNKKRFGCKSPWGNRLVSRRNRAWAAHEKRRKALATRWLCQRLWPSPTPRPAEPNTQAEEEEQPVLLFFFRNVQDSLQQRWQRFLDMTSRRHRRSLTVRMIWKKQKRNLQTMKVLQIASETTRRQVGKLMTSWSLFGKRMNRAVWWLAFVAEQLNHDEWFAALLATRI